MGIKTDSSTASPSPLGSSKHFLAFPVFFSSEFQRPRRIAGISVSVAPWSSLGPRNTGLSRASAAGLNPECGWDTADRRAGKGDMESLGTRKQRRREVTWRGGGMTMVTGEKRKLSWNRRVWKGKESAILLNPPRGG